MNICKLKTYLYSCKSVSVVLVLSVAGYGVCSVVWPVTGILVAGYYSVLYAFLAHGLLEKDHDKYKKDNNQFSLFPEEYSSLVYCLLSLVPDLFPGVLKTIFWTLISLLSLKLQH